MKKNTLKRMFALILAAAMLLAGCGGTGSEANNQTDSAATEVAVEAEKESAVEAEKESDAEAEKESVEKGDLPVITLYSHSALLQSGPVTGFRSDYFAERGGFQMEVWAWSEEKTNAMLVSGDLPDMMFIGAGGLETLETLIETDQIINLDDYKEYLPHVFENPAGNAELLNKSLDNMREENSAGTGGLYCLPTNQGRTTSSRVEASPYDRYIPKLNWEVYQEIGAPEITDLWSLIDIIDAMLEARPTHEDGSEMQGFYLDNGDGSPGQFSGLTLWMWWHAKEAYQYLIEADRVDGTIESIFEEDSVYKEGLKWHSELMRRGLIDPDSVSTPRAEQMAKSNAGYALASGGSITGNPPTYMYVFPSDITPAYNLSNYGIALNKCIVINKNTEHLEECLAYLDMMADPEAIVNLLYGPEGDIWETDGNTFKMTDACAEYVKENGGLDGYQMSDGTSWIFWNTDFLCNRGTAIPGVVGIDGKELGINADTWPEMNTAVSESENWKTWKEKHDAENVFDYFEKNNIPAYKGDAFEGAVVPTMDDAMKLKLSSINEAVIKESYNCVYAKTDEEFEATWKKLKDEAMALGAEDIINFMKDNYKPLQTMSINEY